MRRAVKRLAELALLYGGPAAVSRRRLRRWERMGLIVAYHNVVPHGEAGERTAPCILPRHNLPSNSIA